MILISTPGAIHLSLSPLLPPSATLVSTSNGLLCFSLPTSSSFLVCNILTRSSRIVNFPAHPFSFECLSLISTSTGFKLFVMYSPSSSSHTVFLYDSRVHSWKKFEGFKPTLSDFYRQQGVYFNGSLNFTAQESSSSVVSFDLETGKWGRKENELPGELIFARLARKGNGGLLLFGGIGRNGISRSLKLWELRGGENWEEIGSVPEMMCRKLVSVCYHNYEHLYIFWHQGMVCLCCYTWPEILYYKECTRTWHWLPKCPSLPEKCSCGYRWFSFVPELHALV